MTGQQLKRVNEKKNRAEEKKAARRKRILTMLNERGAVKANDFHLTMYLWDREVTIEVLLQLEKEGEVFYSEMLREWKLTTK